MAMLNNAQSKLPSSARPGTVAVALPSYPGYVDPCSRPSASRLSCLHNAPTVELQTHFLYSLVQRSSVCELHSASATEAHIMRCAVSLGFLKRSTLLYTLMRKVPVAL